MQHQDKRRRNGRVQTINMNDKFVRALQKVDGDVTRLVVGPKGGVKILPASQSKRNVSSLSGRIATSWIDTHNRKVS